MAFAHPCALPFGNARVGVVEDRVEVVALFLPVGDERSDKLGVLDAFAVCAVLSSSRGINCARSVARFVAKSAGNPLAVNLARSASFASVTSVLVSLATSLSIIASAASSFPFENFSGRSRDHQFLIGANHAHRGSRTGFRNHRRVGLVAGRIEFDP